MRNQLQLILACLVVTSACQPKLLIAHFNADKGEATISVSKKNKETQSNAMLKQIEASKLSEESRTDLKNRMQSAPSSEDEREQAQILMDIFAQTLRDYPAEAEAFAQLMIGAFSDLAQLLNQSSEDDNSLETEFVQKALNELVSSQLDPSLLVDLVLQNTDLDDNPDQLRQLEGLDQSLLEQQLDKAENSDPSNSEPTNTEPTNSLYLSLLSSLQDSELTPPEFEELKQALASIPESDDDVAYAEALLDLLMNSLLGAANGDSAESFSLTGSFQLTESSSSVNGESLRIRLSEESRLILLVQAAESLVQGSKEASMLKTETAEDNLLARVVRRASQRQITVTRIVTTVFNHSRLFRNLADETSPRVSRVFGTLSESEYLPTFRKRVFEKVLDERQDDNNIPELTCDSHSFVPGVQFQASSCRIKMPSNVSVTVPEPSLTLTGHSCQDASWSSTETEALAGTIWSGACSANWSGEVFGRALTATQELTPWSQWNALTLSDADAPSGAPSEVVTHNGRHFGLSQAGITILNSELKVEKVLGYNEGVRRTGFRGSARIGDTLYVADGECTTTVNLETDEVGLRCFEFDGETHDVRSLVLGDGVLYILSLWNDTIVLNRLDPETLTRQSFTTVSISNIDANSWLRWIAGKLYLFQWYGTHNVHSSEDGGLTWNNLEFDGQSFGRSYWYDEAGGKRYLATSHGLFVDDGTTVQKISPSLTLDNYPSDKVRTVYPHPDGNKIYAGVWAGDTVKMIRSIDGGSNWNLVNTLPHVDDATMDVWTIRFFEGKDLIASSPVWASSSDDGTTWELIHENFDGFVLANSFVRNWGDTQFIGSWQGAGAYVFRRDERQKRVVFDKVAIDSDKIRMTMMSATLHKGRVLVHPWKAGGIYASPLSDLENWSFFDTPEDGGLNYYYFLGSFGDLLLGAGHNQGIGWTTDLGQPWTRITTAEGLPHDVARAGLIHDNVVYGLTDGGLITTPLAPIQVRVHDETTAFGSERGAQILLHKDRVFVGTSDRKLKSTSDHGDTWSTHLSEWDTHRIFQTESEFFALVNAVDADPEDSPWIMYSKDSGQNWSRLGGADWEIPVSGIKDLWYRDNALQLISWWLGIIETRAPELP